MTGQDCSGLRLLPNRRAGPAPLELGMISRKGCFASVGVRLDFGLGSFIDTGCGGHATNICGVGIDKLSEDIDRYRVGR